MGYAAITASDKMITAGDVQYEPSQQKVAEITPRILLLIAGDFATHSEAIQATKADLKGDENASPHRVAIIYGQALQRIKRREAEDIFLAPFSMNTDSFLSQQNDLKDSFVSDLKDQLQGFQGQDVESLIVGTDDISPHIYWVDRNGSVRCMDDVSFHAIGIGAWHAKSQLMQAKYIKNTYFSTALTQIYAAKRRAEIAPGVGALTDIHIVGRGVHVPLNPDLMKQLEIQYQAYSKKHDKISEKSANNLQEYMNAKYKAQKGSTVYGQDNYGQAGEPAPQASHGDENRQVASAEKGDHKE